MHWCGDYATTLNIEVDPQCRCFGRRESDFALQRLEECRALGPERVRLVALHASGSEEGLAVAAKWASSPGGEWGAKMFVALHNVTNIFFEEARATTFASKPSAPAQSTWSCQICSKRDVPTFAAKVKEEHEVRKHSDTGIRMR